MKSNLEGETFAVDVNDVEFKEVDIEERAQYVFATDKLIEQGMKAFGVVF